MENHGLVRILSMQDIHLAVEVMAYAFEEDPLCVFMLPNKNSRVKTLKKFFYLYGELNITNHHGYGVGEPLKGAAFWLPPAETGVSISIRTLVKFIPLILSPYLPIYLKARTIIKQMDRLHQKYAPEPHYYLDNLGVLPSEWGKGLASQLVRPFVDQAITEKVAVYTDTTIRKNVGLYEHFGFELMEERIIERTGIIIWALLKP
jgi:ribosomal protein S18 acetylase RimI-like enzyme